MSDTPKCKECQTTDAPLWHSKDICCQCHNKLQAAIAEVSAPATAAAETTIDSNAPTDAINKNDVNQLAKDSIEKDIKIEETPASDEKRLRKSTRSTRFKAKSTAVSTTTNSSGGTNNSSVATSSGTKTQIKGRNRRSIFKKLPIKKPYIKASTHTVQSLFHDGFYLQTGDIVSVVDRNGDVYYAQVRGMLIDEYNEKSAFLTWLIPTQESPDPKLGFDAATYLIGPDEEISRKLSCLKFVMHAPSNYYLDRTTPYPLPDEMELQVKPGGYIWTRLPEFKRV